MRVSRDKKNGVACDPVLFYLFNDTHKAHATPMTTIMEAGGTDTSITSGCKIKAVCGLVTRMG